MRENNIVFIAGLGSTGSSVIIDLLKESRLTESYILKYWIAI